MARYFMTGGKAHTLKLLIYGNKIVDLSDVVEPSPVGAALTTFLSRLNTWLQ